MTERIANQINDLADRPGSCSRSRARFSDYHGAGAHPAGQGTR